MTLRFTASSVSKAGTTVPAGRVSILSEPAVSLSIRSARNRKLSHAVTTGGQVACILRTFGCCAEAEWAAIRIANAPASFQNTVFSLAVFTMNIIPRYTESMPAAFTGGEALLILVGGLGVGGSPGH